LLIAFAIPSSFRRKPESSVFPNESEPGTKISVIAAKPEPLLIDRPVGLL
jgi:hypothetical protein